MTNKVIVKKPYIEAVQEFVTTQEFAKLVELNKQNDGLCSNDDERFTLEHLIKSAFLVAGGSSDDLLVTRGARILDDLSKANTEHQEIINQAREKYLSLISDNKWLNSELNGSVTEVVLDKKGFSKS